MRIIPIVFLVLIHFDVVGQDEKAVKLQNEWYNKAENSLDSLEIRRAFYQFYFSYEMLPESTLGQRAKKLSDSLKIILRKKLVEDLDGIWKLHISGKIDSKEEKRHYERFGKYLEVHNDSIFFYKNKKSLRRGESTKEQKIKFSDLKTIFPNYSDVVHSDRKIWNYFIHSNKNKLMIRENGQLAPDGKSRSEDISHSSEYTYFRIEEQKWRG